VGSGFKSFVHFPTLGLKIQGKLAQPVTSSDPRVGEANQF
jgi:hypothetical protein